ncbi:UNVERIFIED_CONTAM: hypothetical protein LK11_02560 [Mumia flava]
MLAAGTLSVFRVPAPSRVDRRRAGIAMAVTPVAALPLAVVVGGVLLLAHALDVPRLLSGAIAVGALALATRAIHLDGLADTADGLTAPYEPARRIEIMRAGDLGPAGAATLFLVLLLQAGALDVLAGVELGWLAAGVAVCVSRAATVLVCMRPVPAATPTGLGASVAGTVPVGTAVSVLMLMTAALCGALLLTPIDWWRGLLAVAIMIVAVGLLVRRCVTVLGGITGDVIGASIEVATVAVLFTITA